MVKLNARFGSSDLEKLIHCSNGSKPFQNHSDNRCCFCDEYWS